MTKLDPKLLEVKHLLFKQKRARSQTDKLLRIKIYLGLHCSFDGCEEYGSQFHSLITHKLSGLPEYYIMRGFHIDKILPEIASLYLLCDEHSKQRLAELEEKKPGTTRKK